MKELEELNKLIAENPDMEVHFMVDLDNTADLDMLVEMVIYRIEIDYYADYCEKIYNDEDELIDDIMYKEEDLSEADAEKKARSLMQKAILVRLGV